MDRAAARHRVSGVDQEVYKHNLQELGIRDNARWNSLDLHVFVPEGLDAAASIDDDDAVTQNLTPRAQSTASEVVVSGDSNLLRLGSHEGIRILKVSESLAEG